MRFHTLFAAPALAIAALVAGCTPLSLVGAGLGAMQPAAAANATILDEKAALGVELAYEAFRTAAELAVDAGVLRGERAATVADLDNRAYQALLVARAAYDTGNATTYESALANARTAIARALVVMKGPSS